MGKNNFYIISGGPGVGKTTLINKFSKNGFLTQEEEARKIIRKQLAKNGDGVPWLNKTLYAQLMLNASIRSYEKMKRDKPIDLHTVNDSTLLLSYYTFGPSPVYFFLRSRLLQIQHFT